MLSALTIDKGHRIDLVPERHSESIENHLEIEKKPHLGENDRVEWLRAALTGPEHAGLGHIGEGLQDFPIDFDIVVTDAFNSDSVPVHLLTREAFDLLQTASAMRNRSSPPISRTTSSTFAT